MWYLTLLPSVTIFLKRQYLLKKHVEAIVYSETAILSCKYTSELCEHVGYSCKRHFLSFMTESMDLGVLIYFRIPNVAFIINFSPH